MSLKVPVVSSLIVIKVNALGVFTSLMTGEFSHIPVLNTCG